jgi:hypothetical protein
MSNVDLILTGDTIAVAAWHTTVFEFQLLFRSKEKKYLQWKEHKIFLIAGAHRFVTLVFKLEAFLFLLLLLLLLLIFMFDGQVNISTTIPVDSN